MALIHIPKTAGTSFREAAARFYGRQQGCFDYGPYAEQTHDLVRRFMLEAHDPGTFRQRFDAGGYRLFSGHVDASRYREAFACSDMVSLVREP